MKLKLRVFTLLILQLGLQLSELLLSIRQVHLINHQDGWFGQQFLLIELQFLICKTKSRLRLADVIQMCSKLLLNAI